MKAFILTSVLLLSVHMGFSQTRFMVSAGMDVIKTDFQAPFKKFQGVIELNYFIRQKLSLNAGYEAWTNGKNYGSLGARFYLFSFIYIKPRLLYNSEDLNGSIGIGYKNFLGRRWRWESSVDYYTDSPEIALRTGLAYIFTK